MDDATLTRQLRSARRWNYALLAFCLLNGTAAAWAIAQSRNGSHTPAQLRAKELVLASEDGGGARMTADGTSLLFHVGPGAPEMRLSRLGPNLELALANGSDDSIAFRLGPAGNNLILGSASRSASMSVNGDMVMVSATAQGDSGMVGSLLIVQPGSANLKVFSGQQGIELAADKTGAWEREYPKPATPR